MKPKKKLTEAAVLAAIKKHSDAYFRTELKSGRGFPDCIISRMDMVYPVEVKIGKDKLSAAQIKFKNNFPLVVVYAGGKLRVEFTQPGGIVHNWNTFAGLLSKELGYE